jgi:inorganic triphosphatase YgiF
MKETELKFQIPAQHLAGVQLALTSPQDARLGPVEVIRLHAAYFDTADHALARRRCALRVRRENDDWVQTFKGAGADAMTRLEENCAVPPPTGERLQPDLSAHSPEVQAALAQALNWQPDLDPRGEQLPLQALYETRFERLQALHQGPHGQVLVCLDQGDLVAGALQSPLAELEFELAEGDAQALIDLARSWIEPHGLWLDVQSKAMKGTRLARAHASGKATVSEAVLLTGVWPEEAAAWSSEAIRRGLSACLDAAAGNWAEVAQAKPGWPQALDAWLQAMEALSQGASASSAVRASLPENFWAQHAQLQQAVQQALSQVQATTSTQANAQPSEPATHAAQDLARAPQTSAWALDLLSALQA